jgi:Fe2+ or Zn2+ uptake regulation protein
MNTPETMELLRTVGKRITPERKLLLRIISENAHLDANEIYHLAKVENPKINLSTVYRTVHLLEELGLVEASELGEDHQHYEVRADEHYHLICLDCGKVVEIPPVDGVRKLGEERGFEVTGVKLELLGYCTACRRKRGHS